MSKRIAIFIHPCHAPSLIYTNHSVVHTTSQSLHSLPSFAIAHPRTEPQHVLSLSLSLSLFPSICTSSLVFPSLSSHSQCITPLSRFLALTTFIPCILHPGMEKNKKGSKKKKRERTKEKERRKPEKTTSSNEWVKKSIEWFSYGLSKRVHRVNRLSRVWQKNQSNT